MNDIAMELEIQQPTDRALVLLLCLMLSLGCSGCSLSPDLSESGDFFKKIFRGNTYTLYRMDIQQGNKINPDRLARLKTGMTKDQVRYLLGNPVADNVFHKNRWHYIYYLVPGEGKTEKYSLVLLFDDDRLSATHRSKNLDKLMQETRRKKSRRIRKPDG